MFDRYPEAKAAFLNGYRRVGHLPEAFDARVHVALGLELVSAMPFFHRWGDAEALALYRRALESWLDTGA